jgi:hypothetical protein
LLGLIAAAEGGQFEAAPIIGGTTVIYPLGSESQVIADNASNVDAGIDYRASYTAMQLKREYSNGAWLFTRIHCESSGKTVASWPTHASNAFTPYVTYDQLVFLAHFRPLSGEPNLTGQTVKLSIKLTAKGKLHASRSGRYGAFDPLRAGYGIGGAGPVGMSRQRLLPELPDPNPPYDYDLPYNDEYWTDPFPVEVGQGGFFRIHYNFLVYGGADNVSEASATGDLFESGFRVSDLNDNLIWEYTRNADGSPGDRFALVLYNANSTGGGTGIPDVLAPGTPPPSISIRSLVNGNPEVDYEGILQQSDDLGLWEDMEPQPAPPFEIVNRPARRFYRARTP